MQPFTKGELFHVPFELRHLVRTQRYSIPGLPCLYLGGSLWICWEELGRPDLQSLHISRFRASPPVQVLDFGYRPLWFRELLAHVLHAEAQREFHDSAVAYAVAWPLIAACSLRVLHQGAPFVPEYIVPQQLLQWIADNSGYHGIRYFSTRVQQYTSSPGTGANFVFPVREDVTEGYCPVLRRMFALSQPIAWPLIQHANLPSTESPNWGRMLELAEGVPVEYLNTDFGRVEGKLEAIECSRL